MKSLKKQIRSKLLLMAFLVTVSICGQTENEKNSLFVRVFSLDGTKINKGKVFSVNDSILQLKKSNEIVKIALRDIGFIKTKRSAFHNVLVGSVIGASTGALLGAATADPDAMIMGYSAGEGAAIGFISGGSVGAAIGGITILLKNSRIYEINGEYQKWKVFQEMHSQRY